MPCGVDLVSMDEAEQMHKGIQRSRTRMETVDRVSQAGRHRTVSRSPTRRQSEHGRSNPNPVVHPSKPLRTPMHHLNMPHFIFAHDLSLSGTA
jgi:hypothetical protein